MGPDLSRLISNQNINPFGAATAALSAAGLEQKLATLSPMLSLKHGDTSPVFPVCSQVGIKPGRRGGKRPKSGDGGTGDAGTPTCLDLAWAAVGPFFLKTVTVSQSLSAMAAVLHSTPATFKIYTEIKPGAVHSKRSPLKAFLPPRSHELRFQE